MSSEGVIFHNIFGLLPKTKLWLLFSIAQTACQHPSSAGHPRDVKPAVVTKRDPRNLFSKLSPLLWEPDSSSFWCVELTCDLMWQRAVSLLDLFRPSERKSQILIENERLDMLSIRSKGDGRGFRLVPAAKNDFCGCRPVNKWKSDFCDLAFCELLYAQITQIC